MQKKNKESNLELIFGFYVMWLLLFSVIYFILNWFEILIDFATIFSVILSFPLVFWWYAEIRGELKHGGASFRLWFFLSLVAALLVLILNS